MGDITQVQAALPDHIRQTFGATQNSDLTQGVSMGYPIVSYKGKNWHIVENGERLLVTRGGNGPDADEPASTITAVILRANPNLNKVYYPDGYEEGSTERPLCHSNDAIAPAADAQEPQSPKCATCKFNQFGSKISDNGARGKACSDSRRLAIAAPDDLENAMLLRVPAASLRTLLAYAQGLEKRGVPYQALTTKIGFDHTVAYPSLTFKAEGWVDAEQAATIREMMDSDLVQNICALNMTEHAAVEEKPAEQDDFLPPGGPPAAETPAATKPRATKATATKAEVQQAVKAAAGTTTAKKSTGFGGGAKAAPAEEPVEAQTPVPDESEVEVLDGSDLAEGALAGLNEALAGFDD